MNTYEIKMITEGNARTRLVQAQSKAHALSIAYGNFSFSKLISITAI